ncbi:hypothetical protein D3C80_1670920 [compost metagenome]
MLAQHRRIFAQHIEVEDEASGRQNDPGSGPDISDLAVFLLHRTRSLASNLCLFFLERCDRRKLVVVFLMLCSLVLGQLKCRNAHDAPRSVDHEAAYDGMQHLADVCPVRRFT